MWTIRNLGCCGVFKTFKILSESDLTSCHKKGDSYFCKGRNDLRTDNTEACLGSLYLQQGKGIQKNCKFEIGAAREKAYGLSHNKWTINAQKELQISGSGRRNTCAHLFYIALEWNSNLP